MIYARLALKHFLLPVILFLGAWGCSSTDESDTANDVTAGDAAGHVEGTKDASSGGSMFEAATPVDHSVASMPDTGTENPIDAKPPMSDAPKIVDAEQVNAPIACVKYCSCMAKWCADKVFATGCLVECTKQTNWDLACRANMCNLVEPQPNNDHCTHAFGKFQCTDN